MVSSQSPQLLKFLDDSKRLAVVKTTMRVDFKLLARCLSCIQVIELDRNMFNEILYLVCTVRSQSSSKTLK